MTTLKENHIAGLETSVQRLAAQVETLTATNAKLVAAAAESDNEYFRIYTHVQRLEGVLGQAIKSGFTCEDLVKLQAHLRGELPWAPIAQVKRIELETEIATLKAVIAIARKAQEDEWPE